MRPGWLFVLLWVGFIVSWLVAASWSGRTEKRVTSPAVWIYRLCIVVGAVLFNHRAAAWFGSPRLWQVGYAGAYAMVLLTLCGFLFAWWARIKLGPLWSGAVTRKEGHRVIDTGPYALVRHPIYTGIIAATLATAVAKATVPALIGFVLIALGFWLKARIEEQFLAAELAPDEYMAYRRRIPMLVPFVPASSGL